MSRWYYTLDNKQRIGPVTSEQLRQLALSGTLHPEHMVMLEGQGKWASASKVKGLFPKAGVAPLPQPAAAPVAPVATAPPVAEALPVEEPLDVLAVEPVEEEDEALEVEPVNAIPTLEEVTSRPSQPALDRSGKFYLCECECCKRDLRVPVDQRGCIFRCPTCRRFFRVWGRPRYRYKTGLPVKLRVSAFFLQWPMACACCLRQHDDFLDARHLHELHNEGQAMVGLAIWAFAGKEAMEKALPHDSWKVPYCWDCLEHVKSRRKDRLHKGCTTVAPAVEYHGYQGSVHTFSFYNWRYANQFLELNQDKCIG